MSDAISAKFLLAPKLGKRDAVSLAGCTITVLPAKIAAGARKVRVGGGGAQPTSAIFAQADRRALTGYAARR